MLQLSINGVQCIMLLEIIKTDNLRSTIHAKNLYSKNF